MSFLTDTDLNKRAGNLYVAFQPPAAGVPGVTIIAEQADMTYFATYTADVPGVVAITGVYDPATLGAAGTLSAGDTVVEFSGQGAVLGTVTNNTDSSCCEFLIGTNASESVGFYIAGLAPPYDPDVYAGDAGSAAFFSFAAFYDPAGGAYGFAGGSGGNAPFTAGDVVGVVYDNNTGQVRFYVNGVFSTQVGASNSSMRPMTTLP